MNQSLMECLRELHLPGVLAGYENLAEVARRESFSYEKYLQEVVERERQLRHEKRVQRLLERDFVQRRENVLAFGNPGSGKSHLLCALGHELVRRGATILFRPCELLVQELQSAHDAALVQIGARRYDSAHVRGGRRMIEKKRFALNRITCPSLGLDDFFRFTADLGLSKVEIRNDLPGGAVIDGMPPAKAAELAQRHGISILSINALQKFNLKAMQAKNQAELEMLLELAAALRCTAIVMCPNNDTQDHRDARSRVEETVAALKAFGPSFTKRGIQGWVEPLGFPESSLSSVIVAGEAVKRSGFDCYRIVYDTFHHYLGPDTEKDIDGSFASSQAGLIHVSGVEASIPKENCRDEHRVLLSSADRMGSKGQIARMVSLGYAGDISFEPFSADVQRMNRDALAAALTKSIEYVRG